LKFAVAQPDAALAAVVGKDPLPRSAEGPEHLLAHLLTLAHAVDNLEILVGAGAFDSEKHRGFLTLHRATTDL
jgi:hypothetical protein